MTMNYSYQIPVATDQKLFQPSDISIYSSIIVIADTKTDITHTDTDIVRTSTDTINYLQEDANTVEYSEFFNKFYISRREGGLVGYKSKKKIVEFFFRFSLEEKYLEILPLSDSTFSYYRLFNFAFNNKSALTETVIYVIINQNNRFGYR